MMKKKNWNEIKRLIEMRNDKTRLIAKVELMMGIFVIALIIAVSIFWIAMTIG